MKKLFVLSPSIVLPFALTAYAAEPDFYIRFSSCKVAVGYLVLSEESLRIIEGDPTTMVCFRSGEEISCSFTFSSGEDGNKGNFVDYKIVIDSPPLLHFFIPNGSEYVAVDTSQHAAVLMSRVLGMQYAGSKVCQGFYATSFEMKSLEK